MKKVFCIILYISIWVVMMAGCTKVNDIQSNGMPSNTVTPTPTAIPAYSEPSSTADVNAVMELSTKVILDCDMGYVNDDAFAMMMLAQADKLGDIDLLGVAVSGGNKTGAVAVNVALLQLEAVGRTDIPVYIGRDEPLLGFNTERAAKQDYAGDVYSNMDKYVPPENYHNLGELYSPSWGYSKTEAQNISAVQFMVEQVKQYPGEVTILCIGPATNVALACQADETFAANTAGIIYMGGNMSDESSFNWSYDADAVKVCLESAFPKQIICTSEIVESMKIPPQFLKELAELETSEVAQFFVERSGIANANKKLWDVVIPAILLCPELVVKSDEATVTVSVEEDSYGLMSFAENGTKAIVVSEVNGPDIYALMRKLFESEGAVIHTLNLQLPGKECTLEAIGKKRSDMDLWGVRELLVYSGAELLQTISVQEAILADGVDGIDKGYTECPDASRTVALRDVNFDGYLDLEVWGWCPNNSIPYYYWCWNEETQQFEYAFCLQLTDVDEERKHLISYQKVGGGVYYIERYRVTGENKLELVERMTEDYRTFDNWTDAYLDVVNSFPDNLLNPRDFRDITYWTDTEKYMYLGIHDFDADGIPELIIGDGTSMAVFTLRDGTIEKCADITMQCCWACIDGVAFRDNAILAECDGSDGSGYTALVYKDGKWISAVYCEYHPEKCTVNGKTATYEEFCEAVPFEPKDWEGSIKPYNKRLQYLGFPLSDNFDFEEFRWTVK